MQEINCNLQTEMLISYDSALKFTTWKVVTVLNSI